MQLNSRDASLAVHQAPRSTCIRPDRPVQPTLRPLRRLSVNVFSNRKPVPASDCLSRQQAVTSDRSSNPEPLAVLVVDATNVAALAAADTKRWRPVGGKLHASFSCWLSYLQALTQADVAIAAFDLTQDAHSHRRAAVPDYLRNRRHPRARTSLAGKQQPDTAQRSAGGLQVVARQAGYLPVVAPQGWEADDAIGALCSLLAQGSTCEGAARVIIASADTGFSALLGERVSWLHILHQPTVPCPTGIQLVTGSAFAAEHGMQPSAYSDLLALTGKAEASIGGCGISARSARSLLQHFGSLEAAAAAAAQGRLRGWDERVQRLLDPDSPAHARLHRNRAVLAVCQDPSILDQHVVAAVQSALEAARGAADCSSSPSSSHAEGWQKLRVSTMQGHTAWLHPYNASRWGYIRPLAERASQLLGTLGVQHSLQYATPDGAAIDIAIIGAAGVPDPTRPQGAAKGWALIICGRCDVRASELSSTPAGAGQRRAEVHSGTGYDKGHLGVRPALLNARAGRQLRLLKKLGWQVVLLPGTGLQAHHSDEECLVWLQQLMVDNALQTPLN